MGKLNYIEELIEVFRYMGTGKSVLSAKREIINFIMSKLGILYKIIIN